MNAIGLDQQSIVTPLAFRLYFTYGSYTVGLFGVAILLGILLERFEEIDETKQPSVSFSFLLPI